VTFDCLNVSLRRVCSVGGCQVVCRRFRCHGDQHHQQPEHSRRTAYPLASLPVVTAPRDQVPRHNDVIACEAGPRHGAGFGTSVEALARSDGT